jgi:hypothetical protein
MRVKIELLLSAIFVIGISVGIAYAAPGAQWSCQGAFNCAGVNCYNPTNGYSCALVTPVNHRKCVFTGDDRDSCDTVSKTCATVRYFLGGACNNNVAPYCDTSLPVGQPMDLTEDGC